MLQLLVHPNIITLTERSIYCLFSDQKGWKLEFTAYVPKMCTEFSFVIAKKHVINKCHPKNQFLIKVYFSWLVSESIGSILQYIFFIYYLTNIDLKIPRILNWTILPFKTLIKFENAGSLKSRTISNKYYNYQRRYCGAIQHVPSRTWSVKHVQYSKHSTEL